MEEINFSVMGEAICPEEEKSTNSSSALVPWPGPSRSGIKRNAPEFIDFLGPPGGSAQSPKNKPKLNPKRIPDQSTNPVAQGEPTYVSDLGRGSNQPKEKAAVQKIERTTKVLQSHIQPCKHVVVSDDSTGGIKVVLTPVKNHQDGGSSSTGEMTILYENDCHVIDPEKARHIANYVVSCEKPDAELKMGDDPSRKEVSPDGDQNVDQSESQQQSGPADDAAQFGSTDEAAQSGPGDEAAQSEVTDEEEQSFIVFAEGLEDILDYEL